MPLRAYGSGRPLIPLLCLIVQIVGALFLALLVVVGLGVLQRQREIDRKVDMTIRSQAEIDRKVDAAIHTQEEIRAYAQRQTSANRRQIDALIKLERERKAAEGREP
jgi:hypothetical protein